MAGEAARKPEVEPAASKATAKTGGDGQAPPWALSLGEFKLEGAKIVFDDEANAQPFHTTVDPVTFQGTLAGKGIALARFAPYYDSQILLTYGTAPWMSACRCK